MNQNNTLGYVRVFTQLFEIDNNRKSIINVATFMQRRASTGVFQLLYTPLVSNIRPLRMTMCIHGSFTLSM